MRRRRFVIMLVWLMLFPVAMYSAAQNETVTTTGGAFQQYEGGFMLWRSDTGDIWVLTSGGNSIVFSEAAYASLPGNPVADRPPRDRIVPVSGFGRVWGNFPDVRDALGWATTGEIAYTQTWENIALIGNGAIALRVNFPDGPVVLLRDDNTWQYSDGGEPTAPPPPTTIPEAQPLAGSYQSFEGGFMIWFADTGTIWTFFDSMGSGQGTYQQYNAALYGDLPDTPYRMAPPRSGQLRPVFGFGKVWAFFPDARARLGWATNTERGVILNRADSPSNSTEIGAGTVIDDPDGRAITITGPETWVIQ